MANETIAQGDPTLPMLYQKLVALTPEAHLGWGVLPHPNHGCAKAANAIPLGVSEFFPASSHCPVVFAPAASGGVPVAVTAIVEGRNLFVDDAGTWLDSAYLPGYLRRHPFWVSFDAEGQRASVWFDPEAGTVVPLAEHSEARPLFDYRGNISQALRQVIDFSRLCAMEEAQTAAFVQTLEGAGLLRDQQIRVQLPSGQDYVLTGFRTVDESAYRNLPDAQLADWARKGWTGLIEVHLASMQQNWSKLLVLHRKRQTEALPEQTIHQTT